MNYKKLLINKILSMHTLTLKEKEIASIYLYYTYLRDENSNLTLENVLALYPNAFIKINKCCEDNKLDCEIYIMSFFYFYSIHKCIKFFNKKYPPPNYIMNNGLALKLYYKFLKDCSYLEESNKLKNKEHSLEDAFKYSFNVLNTYKKIKCSNIDLEQLVNMANSNIINPLFVFAIMKCDTTHYLFHTLNLNGYKLDNEFCNTILKVYKQTNR